MIKGVMSWCVNIMTERNMYVCMYVCMYVYKYARNPRTCLCYVQYIWTLHYSGLETGEI